MYINILSHGRFHVLDLTRELDALGYDVRFYSFVPTRRAVKFGLRKECSSSLYLIMLPFLVIAKVFPFTKCYVAIIQDYLTAWLMRPCDVLIAMSGCYVYSLKYAKQKFNSTIILERGSKHILEQKRILEGIPSLKDTVPVPAINVKRELEGYELADYVSIASEHVKESFIDRGYPVEKLFVNPYGVDLKDFYPIPCAKNFDIIMVGNWSYQKGCDLLIEICQELKIKLLHVGVIGDVSNDEIGYITHIRAVSQKELVKYYAQAKVFVLPSRQEGLALVQPQALASGLPIVCSQHTGGRDIGKYTNMEGWIFEMEEYTVKELKKQILEALRFAERADNSELDLSNITWKAYGKRYGYFLNTI